MKILLVSTNFSPEITGIGKYSGEMAAWLSDQSHDVRVICAPPYYPEWRVRKDYSIWRYGKEVSEHLCVYRCPLWVPTRPSGLKRIIHLLSFAVSSFPVVLSQVFWSPQVVICVEPPLFNSLASAILSRLSGGKSILHIQDFEVDAAFDLGIVKSGWLKKFIYGVESFLLRRFDKVSTISEVMLEKLGQKTIEPVNRILFPNWVDTSFIFPLDCPSAYREELDIDPQKIIAMYSGNMGEKQGLEIVIQAAYKLSGSNIQFVMCGAGVALDRLKVMAVGLENILWLPLQPFDRLNDFLNLADIHLLPQQSGATDLVMPSKLTGILSSGRPVVATAKYGSQVERVVKDRGLIVEPENIDAFSQAIETLANDAGLREVMGREARKYAVENLEYQVIMQRFEHELDEILNGK